MKRNDLYAVFAYGKWGLVDRNGNQVVPIIYICMYGFFSTVEEILYVTKEDGKMGILDTNKREEIIPAIYDSVHYLDENRCFVLKDKIWYIWGKDSLRPVGEYKYIDSVYDCFIRPFADNVNDEIIRFGNERYKECCHRWTEDLESVYYSVAEMKRISKSEVHVFYDNLSKVRIDGKYGFINRSLELIVPAIYDHAEDFKNGFAYVEIGNENHYINTQGQQVISGVFRYDDSSDDFDGLGLMEGVWDELACYEENGLIGLKGLNNQIVTLPIYDYIDIGYSENKKYVCAKDEKCGIIDNNGNLVLECEYDEINSFGGDLFCIGNYYYSSGGLVNGKSGIINVKNKQIVVPLKYTGIYPVENCDNLAKVTIEPEVEGDEHKCGVLNIYSQEFVVPPIYDRCWECGDLFFVEKEDKWGYFDFQGNVVVEVEQDFDYYLCYCFYSPDKDGKWTRKDEEGRTVDAPEKKEVYFENWKPIVSCKNGEIDSMECYQWQGYCLFLYAIKSIITIKKIQ